MSILKQIYVAGARMARSGAKATGLLSALERRSKRRRLSRWARSLFAIYDIDDMVRLDLPWWTLGAIDEVDEFLARRPAARVFEYGSGASTIWLAKRAKEVFSVEHDEGWFPVVHEKLKAFPNAHLHLVPADEPAQSDPAYASTKPGWVGRTFRSYVHALDEVDGEFDVIVVDGRARPACLPHAVKRLAEGGLVVFDNSRRPQYRSAISQSGLLPKTIGGLTACLPYPDETTLLRHA